MIAPSAQHLLVAKRLRRDAYVYDVELGEVLQQYVTTVGDTNIRVLRKERLQPARELRGDAAQQVLDRGELARHPLARLIRTRHAPLAAAAPLRHSERPRRWRGG